MENVAQIVCTVLALGVLTSLMVLTGNVKEWLKWAVAKAENELGSGTGELKLRRVYDWAVEKFPIIKYILPFCIFSAWVDVALKTLKSQIESNEDIKRYVGGGAIEHNITQEESYGASN